MIQPTSSLFFSGIHAAVAPPPNCESVTIWSLRHVYCRQNSLTEIEGTGDHTTDLALIGRQIDCYLFKYFAQPTTNYRKHERSLFEYGMKGDGFWNVWCVANSVIKSPRQDHCEKGTRPVWWGCLILSINHQQRLFIQRRKLGFTHGIVLESVTCHCAPRPWNSSRPPCERRSTYQPRNQILNLWSWLERFPCNE